MNFQPTSTTETEAKSLLSNQGDQGVQPLQFTRDNTYTTFESEHAFDEDDIVFHFFRATENSGDTYWKKVFPDVLSDVAQAVFEAGYPRLKAAFTDETDSWWMRANSFANTGLPEERVRRFYQKLDEALEARLKTSKLE
jgi:hypothetical protein